MKQRDGKSASQQAAAQLAALCYRVTRKKGTQILLITSRETGRWVIPKGWPMKNRDDAEAARQEAFEEAGVKGALGACLGLFTYDKVMGDGSARPVVVSVFPLRVEEICAEFPEKGQRQRKWFSPRKAAARVNEPDLKQLIAAFDPAGPGSPGPGKA